MRGSTAYRSGASSHRLGAPIHMQIWDEQKTSLSANAKSICTLEKHDWMLCVLSVHKSTKSLV